MEKLKPCTIISSNRNIVNDAEKQNKNKYLSKITGNKTASTQHQKQNKRK